MSYALLKKAVAGDIVGTSNALQKLAVGLPDAAGEDVATVPPTTVPVVATTPAAPLRGVPGAPIDTSPSIIQPQTSFNAAKAVKGAGAQGKAVGIPSLRAALPDIENLTYTDTLDDGSKMETGLYDPKSVANFAALFGGAAARRNAFTRHGAIIGNALSSEEQSGDGSNNAGKIDLSKGRPDFSKGRPDFSKGRPDLRRGGPYL